MGVKISLIIPVFNAESYLAECLSSIISQTLKEIEIICIDDGSTDQSVKIIRKFQRKDKRILLLRQENKGAASARNAGLHVAKGEFLAFIDADDWYPESDILEYLYLKAKENNVRICGGSFSSYKNGEIIEKYVGLNSPYVFEKEGLTKYKDYQFEFGYQRFIFDRVFLAERNIEFPDYLRFQDPPFFVRAMTAAGEFYAVPKIVYRYREDYKEIRWTPRKAMDLLQGLTDILMISDQNNFDELHNRSFRRLCSDLYTKIIFNVAREDPAYCMQYLYRASRAVNIPTVRKFDKCIDENFIFPALDKLLHYPLFDLPEKQPKVSVIIPVYNVEEFIIECVESVVRQTLQDIEIICVDDGSPDQSIEKVKSVFGQDSRIKYVYKNNGGLSSARNAGVRVACGEYIYFLDSDDILDTKALEILYNEAKENNLDLLVFDADSFSDERFTPEEEKAFMSRKVQGYLNYYNRAGDYSEIVKGQVLFLRMVSKNEHRSAVWLQFIRREFYWQNKIDSYNGIIHEDNLFTLKTFLLAERAKHIPYKFYHRRVRLGSIMTEKEGIKNLIGYFVSYCEALRFLSRKCSSLYPKVCDAYIKIINEYVRSVRRITKKITEEERTQFYNSLNHFERTIYDYIMSSDRLEELIDRLCVTAAEVEGKINEIVVSVSAGGRQAIAPLQNTIPINNSNLEGKTEEAVRQKKGLKGKVRGFFRCLKERGFRYTMVRLFGGRKRAQAYAKKRQLKRSSKIA